MASYMPGKCSIIKVIIPHPLLSDQLDWFVDVLNISLWKINKDQRIKTAYHSLRKINCKVDINLDRKSFKHWILEIWPKRMWKKLKNVLWSISNLHIK